MSYWVGFDVGKRFHWMCVLDGDGAVLLSRRVDATEEHLEAACSEIAALGEAEERVIGIDLLGGLATLLETILLERGERARYIPGTAVNKVRDAYPGGEHKSDPNDAFVIADQLRLRWKSLRKIRVREENAAELRTLVGYRKDLVQDQRRRVCRLRESLSRVFPALEATLPDLAEKGALLTVAKVALPSDARRLGKSRLARWLKARGSRRSEALAEKALLAARAQRRELPAAEVKAALVSEIAWELLRTKERIDGLEKRLGELVEANRSGEIVGSLPGMGLILTAEFLAEVDETSLATDHQTASPQRRTSRLFKGIRKTLLPATNEKGQQGTQKSAPPIRVLRDWTPQEKQGLLPAKTFRGQAARPGSDGAGTAQGQCSVGDAQRQDDLPGGILGRLTTASGYSGG